MTPLEAIVEGGITAARDRAWYASAEWERRTLAEIHAKVNRAHRSIGQLFRRAGERLAV